MTRSIGLPHFTGFCHTVAPSSFPFFVSSVSTFAGDPIFEVNYTAVASTQDPGELDLSVNANVIIVPEE